MGQDPGQPDYVPKAAAEPVPETGMENPHQRLQSIYLKTMPTIKDHYQFRL